MITIENTCNKAIVFADEIDAATHGLIDAFCGSPVSLGSRLRIMPDAHAGKGCVIGTTMTLTDKVIPGMIGSDIGCGITAIKFRKNRLELQQADKRIREKIPAGKKIRERPHRFAEKANLERLYCKRHIQRDKAYASIGTLGGGNHFIEIDKDRDGAFWLIIHSGSRHLGYEVASFYRELAFRQCDHRVPYEFAFLTGTQMEEYLKDLAAVQAFAELNRLAIADEIIKELKLRKEETIQCVHNYIDTEERILRKGAISAKKDETVIIPMNMRDGCLIAKGKGNPQWNRSAPHGAGRRMNRLEARNTFTLSQYKKEMKGIFSTSVSGDTLDECPMAYKSPESILARIEPTVEVTERITPIYNFKAGEPI